MFLGYRCISKGGADVNQLYGICENLHAPSAITILASSICIVVFDERVFCSSL
jgi:hypothetical protein